VTNNNYSKNTDEHADYKGSQFFCGIKFSVSSTTCTEDTI